MAIRGRMAATLCFLTEVVRLTAREEGQEDHQEEAAIMSISKAISGFLVDIRHGCPTPTPEDRGLFQQAMPQSFSDSIEALKPFQPEMFIAHFHSFALLDRTNIEQDVPCWRDLAGNEVCQYGIQ
jgi:hypothetical protein